ncbi:MAG TPA: hypothetical protein P5234_09595 [Thermoanaerobaculaceae bacterium]|nr:hypothetical protein [Thermoanaerobaculaceae bacterium]HRS16484.1 hypothetical protein [Thermoanaerobaculaceae bacterium]
MRLLAGCLVLAAVLTAAAASGQGLDWRTDFTFYGDNTEFFNSYRTGETLLGASVRTALAFELGPRTEALAGVFCDIRSGSEQGAREVKPVLSLRWRGETSTAVMGTLLTEHRHRILEPLRTTSFDITRQVEQGLQWIEQRQRWQGEAYINWQRLNTPRSREIFDYGLVVEGRPAAWLGLEAQLHGLHHGGQLHQAGAVSNNTVWAAGARARHRLGASLAFSLAAFRLASAGKVDPFVDGPTITGRGTYVRAGAELERVGEAFVIVWRGRDFISHEGDRHYGSIGRDGSFARSHRAYEELGFVHRRRVAERVDVSLEARLHRVDGDFDYSYRILVRSPFALRLVAR